MIDSRLRQPITAGEVLAHIRAGLVLSGRNWEGEYEWIGHRDKWNAVPTHLKSIVKKYEQNQFLKIWG